MYLAEDLEQFLDRLERRKLGLEDVIFWELHPDYGFRVAWFFEQVVVLLLPSVHELGVLTRLFESFLDTHHINHLILIELLLLAELTHPGLRFIMLCLRNFDLSILDWLRHELFSLSFQLGQFFIEDD